MDEVKSSGLDFPESARLKKNLGAVNDWVSKAKAALAGSVALRELEKLLTEADKLAVDPGPKQPELQAKMNKALVWLEKVRKAVPKQRFTRRNTPDAEAEKVCALAIIFAPLLSTEDLTWTVNCVRSLAKSKSSRTFSPIAAVHLC